MKKLFALIFTLMFSFAVAAPAMASEFDFRNTFEEFAEGLEEQSGDLEEGTEAITIPTFQDDRFGENDGLSGIVGTIDNFLNFFKLIVTPIVIIFVVIMGVRMVTAGSDSEEMITKSKNYIMYAVQGLIIIFVADSLINVFFGAEGEIFRAGEAGAQEFGRRSSQLIEGMFTLIETIIGAVAIFMLITAGMRYVAGSYSDDQIATAKRQIMWSVVGLFIIAVSELVVKDILFQDQGQALGVDQAKQLFAQVTNFIAGTMGTLSFAFLLYAGYLYVTGSGNDENIAKAKKIIIGAFIGLILAAAAFALTTTIVELDPTR